MHFQCSIPVFEGLLPGEHNERLMDLLFVFAHWHGLAKLRLHTDHTVDILDTTTTLLGQHLRDFVEHTCNAVSTKELKREYEARKRREAKKKSKSKPRGPKRKDDAAEPGPMGSTTEELTGAETIGTAVPPLIFVFGLIFPKQRVVMRKL
jgi:hypothetical protein